MRFVVVFLFIMCGCLSAQSSTTEQKKQALPSPPLTDRAGVAWYSTWRTALAEATRSQRPIFFIATPCQRAGISGIFQADHARTQRELLLTPEFIELSRKFVCVRLATFESQEHLNMVRFLLHNTPSPAPHSAFTIFTPDGKTQLLPAQPSPLGASDTASKNKKTFLQNLTAIAQNYPSQAPLEGAVMEDFHSFTQALRTSAADQRLLFFIVAPHGNRMPYWTKAQAIINDPEVLGKIHVDFIGASDQQWHQVIVRDSMQAGYFIIKPGEFGRDGRMVAELPLMTSSSKIKATLLNAHELYRKEQPERNDAEHLRRGKELGVSFQSTIPVPTPTSLPAPATAPIQP